MKVDVYLEVGVKRVFACASDWPGWCRSAKDEQGAVEALVSCAPRYSVVADEAGVKFAFGRTDRVSVAERIKGGATTDFGAPEKPAKADATAWTQQRRQRHVALMRAAWGIFDEIVAGAKPVLRKGPRGGGRDRDAIARHVLEAEAAYARKIGVRLKAPDYRDRGAVGAEREAISSALSSSRGPEPLVEKGWVPRYALRRITWHVLDHAWEIEDREPVSESYEDRIAIERLMYEYAERIDRGDLRGLAELLADAVIGPAGVDAGVRGTDAIFEMFSSTVRIYEDGTPRTRHLTTNVSVELAPDSGSATAHSYFTVLQSSGPHRLQPIVAGSYFDRFERRGDGAWCFVERRFSTDLVGDVSAHMRSGAERLLDSPERPD